MRKAEFLTAGETSKAIKMFYISPGLTGKQHVG